MVRRVRRVPTFDTTRAFTWINVATQVVLLVVIPIGHVALERRLARAGAADQRPIV